MGILQEIKNEIKECGHCCIELNGRSDKVDIEDLVELEESGKIVIHYTELIGVYNITLLEKEMEENENVVEEVEGYVFYKNVRIDNSDFCARPLIEYLKSQDDDLVRNLMYAKPGEGSVFFQWFTRSEPFLDQEEISMP